MILDKIKIGVRVREIREKIYKETRQDFAERCGISENNLGKIERGEICISIKALTKICSSTGVTSDYILYGKCENGHLNIRNVIDNFLDNSSKEELKMYFKFINAIKGYIESDK